MAAVYHRQGGWSLVEKVQVTYVVSFPLVLKTVKCPVIGCPEVARSAGRLREHFMYQHFFSQISLLQEGKEPLPHCDLCSMHMPAGQLIKNQQIKRCNRNT